VHVPGSAVVALVAPAQAVVPEDGDGAHDRRAGEGDQRVALGELLVDPPGEARARQPLLDGPLDHPPGRGLHELVDRG